MALQQNMNSFLAGVVDSSILHSAGFIGFVAGNVAYYRLFSYTPMHCDSSPSWIYKYITSIPTIAGIAFAYYIGTDLIPETTIGLSYTMGAIIPHLFFIRNVNIICQFDK